MRSRECVPNDLWRKHLRSIVRSRGNSLQTQHRASICYTRRNLSALSASGHGSAICSPITVAANRRNYTDKREGSTGFEYEPFAASAIPETPDPQLATLDAISQSPKAGIEAELQNDQVGVQTAVAVHSDSQPQPEKRIFKLAAGESSKANRLLVNRLLKDKGPSSYDWRVPFDLLLEQHHRQRDAEISNEHKRVHRPVFAGIPNQDIRLQPRHQTEPQFACDIVQPKVWSASTLLEYVEKLANSHYGRDEISQSPQARTKRQFNVGHIVRAFDRIFHSPGTRRYLSIKAYTIALDFYYSHGIFSKARSLFFQLVDSKMQISTETFNILIKGAASSHDLHNFTYVVRRAIQLGFKPNLETWNMLLMVVNSNKVKAVIIQNMREEGVIDAMLNRSATRVIVQTELASHIDRLGNRGAILQRLDKVYSNAWLTTSTGNRLLDEFSKRVSLPEALALLPGLKLRGFVPDEISMVTLLQQCLVSKQHKSAIETLRAFHHQFGRQPGRQAYEIMFRLAWKSRLLNVAKCVWGSAIVRGLTTYQMRRLVHRSLPVKVSMEALTKKRERFEGLFGRYIVSITSSDKFGRLQLEPNLQLGLGEIKLHTAEMSHQDRLSFPRSSRFIGPPQDLGRKLLKALDQDLKLAAKNYSQKAILQQMIRSYLESVAPTIIKDSTKLKPQRPFAFHRVNNVALRRANGVALRRVNSFAIHRVNNFTLLRVNSRTVRRVNSRTVRRVKSRIVRRVNSLVFRLHRVNNFTVRRRNSLALHRINSLVLRRVNSVALHRVNSLDEPTRKRQSSQTRHGLGVRRRQVKNPGSIVHFSRIRKVQTLPRISQPPRVQNLEIQLRPEELPVGRGTWTNRVSPSKQATPISPSIRKLPQRSLVRKHLTDGPLLSAASAAKQARRPSGQHSSEEGDSAAQRQSVSSRNPIPPITTHKKLTPISSHDANAENHLENSPLRKPNRRLSFQKKRTPLFRKKTTPLFRKKSTPLFRKKTTPLFRKKSTPLFRKKSTPLFRKEMRGLIRKHFAPWIEKHPAPLTRRTKVLVPRTVSAPPPPSEEEKARMARAKEEEVYTKPAETARLHTSLDQLLDLAKPRERPAPERGPVKIRYCSDMWKKTYSGQRRIQIR